MLKKLRDSLLQWYCIRSTLEAMRKHVRLKALRLGSIDNAIARYCCLQCFFVCNQTSTSISIRFRAFESGNMNERLYANIENFLFGYILLVKLIIDFF